MRWLLVVLAACSNTDSDSDVPIPEGHGEAFVHVMRNGIAIADATVIFHGRSGEVQGRAITDALGHARGELDTPGMITVVDPMPLPATGRRLFTVTHVIPDETIVVPLESFTSWGSGPEIGTLTIAAPPNSPPTGTDHFSVHLPCGNFEAPSLPATLPLYAGCATSNMPVIVMAATPNGSLEDPGTSLAYVAGMTDATSTLTPGAWSTACGEVIAKTEPLMSLNFATRFGGHVFRHTWPGFCQTSTPPAGYYAYSVLDFGEGAHAYTFSYLETSLRKTYAVRDHEALPAMLSIDRDRDLLVGDTELTRFDGSGVEWTSDVALGIADTIVADVTWVLASPSHVTWRFVLPNTMQLRVPSLPDDVAMWSNLDAATSRILDLHYLDASWTTDLHALHAQLPALLDTLTPAPDGMLRRFTEQFYPDAEN